ncbi:DUF4397 domain-containing protein [Pedobacter sp. JCM 36344]|uniref:DUF4397 domain-containing protein n=1 Tax=Pedobacter sp. JCM 36344 TaxID=3374280 RepID=UPI00397A5486
MKIKSLIAALAITTLLGSCMKDQEIQPQQPVAGLSIVQASPTTENLDVYVDSTRAVSDLAYAKKVDYLNLFPGNRRLAVKKKGSQTTLLAEQLTLKDYIGYTLFIVDQLETVKFLFLEDDLAKPANGKAKVRFVNLSPDAPALNLSITGKEADLVTNKLFKEYSTFAEIDAAEKVTFNVKNKETGALETSIADVKVDAGGIYTIWVKGLKSATDSKKLGVAIFQHK